MAIVITGASSGVGRAIAERFAELGNDVVINYHSNDAGANECADVVRSRGARAHVFKVDVGNEAGAKELIHRVQSITSSVDQFVHCAAVPVRGPLLEVDATALEDCIRLNGTGLVYLVREALPLLHRGSSVFYISSRGARFALPGYGSLGAAKALGEMLVRYLAIELAPLGIRCNAVSPGALDTPAFREMFKDTWQERLKIAAETNPSKRRVEFSDVVDVIYRLAGDEFQMMQGQVLALDGGVTL